MTMYTLGQVMSNATQMLGNRSDVAESLASFWANEGAAQVFKSQFHEAQESIAVSSTTSGENRITMPTDFYELINVSDLSLAQPSLLRPLLPDQVDSASTEIGRPTRFVEYSTWLELWPVPDSTYSVQMRYRARQSVMTTTTAVPSFDTRYGLAWTYKTTELLADVLLDHERASLYRSKYISEMAATPNDFALRQRSAREGQRFSMLSQGVTRFLDFDKRDVE
jgi:hypothetical protein